MVFIFVGNQGNIHSINLYSDIKFMYLFYLLQSKLNEIERETDRKTDREREREGVGGWVKRE